MSGPEFVSPPELGTPPGYSHAVGIPEGRLVWTSGQVALDAAGNLAADAGWEGQTRLVFANVGRPPTSSLVRVAGLVRPDLLIEVEAVAWRP